MIQPNINPTLFMRISPLLAQISNRYGIKFIGVFHSRNVGLLPPEWLSSLVVVEEGSLFNLGMKSAPIPQKLFLWDLAMRKAKSMGVYYVALRLPTKWERFKVWGWRKLPKREEVKAKDRSPIPVTMRPPRRALTPMEKIRRPVGVVGYGQRISGNEG